MSVIRLYVTIHKRILLVNQARKTEDEIKLYEEGFSQTNLLQIFVDFYFLLMKQSERKRTD